MTDPWKSRRLPSLLGSALFTLGVGCVQAAPHAYDAPAASAPTVASAAAPPNASPSANPTLNVGGTGAAQGPTAVPAATQKPPESVPDMTGMTGVAGMTGIALPPAPTANAHWLSYGNGPKNQFYNAAETQISVDTAPMLKQLWSVQLGEVTGAPAVVGERVYMVSSSGTFALDAKDGSTVWMANNLRGTSAPFYDEPTNSLIVAASAGTINALDAETGAIKWTSRMSMQNGGMAWSSPIVSGRLAVVGLGANETASSFKGGIAAFDAQTGAKQWEYLHCTTAGASVWSGPGADDDGVVYATTGNNYVRTDDRSDSIFAAMPGMQAASMLWTFQATMNDGWTFNGGQGGDHDFGANPIIVDLDGQKLIAAGAKSGEFHLLDRMTGRPIAKQKLCSTTSEATGGILNNGAFDGKNNLFIAAANEGLQPGKTVAMAAAPEKMLEKVWEKKNSGVVWAPISSANGVCFVPDNTVLRVLNCQTGQELNMFDGKATIGSAAAISEGRVFFGAGFSYGLGPVTSGRNFIALGLQ